MLDSLSKLWIMQWRNGTIERCRPDQESPVVLTSPQITRRWILLIPFAALFMAGAAAEENLDFPMDPESSYSLTDRNQYACLRDGMIRAVYIEYSEIAGEPPCAVVYEKSSPEEASREIPWRAQADMGFCELHARELVEKLRNWGWKCGLFRDVLGIDE